MTSILTLGTVAWACRAYHQLKASERSSRAHHRKPEVDSRSPTRTPCTMHEINLSPSTSLASNQMSHPNCTAAAAGEPLAAQHGHHCHRHLQTIYFQLWQYLLRHTPSRRTANPPHHCHLEMNWKNVLDVRTIECASCMHSAGLFPCTPCTASRTVYTVSLCV